MPSTSFSDFLKQSWTPRLKSVQRHRDGDGDFARYRAWMDVVTEVTGVVAKASRTTYVIRSQWHALTDQDVDLLKTSVAMLFDT